MAELLNFVVWLPVAGMLAIALVPASQENVVRQLTLWLMIVQFVATAVLYVNFDSSVAGCSSRRACHGSRAGASATTSGSTASTSCW